MHHPFFAPLKQKTIYAKEGSTKKVCSLVFDIEESKMQFSPGDCAAILPMNDPLLVKKTIQKMHASPTEKILHQRSGQTFSLEEFLTRHASITRFSSHLLSLLFSYQKDPKKKEFLRNLLDPANKLLLQEYLPTHEVWDLLEEFGSPLIPFQEIATRLMPLLPRLFSIASSLAMHPKEIRLLVGLVSYETNHHERYGVTSHYLCDLVQEGDKVPLYVQPSHGFSLPEDSSKDIIMIGSGTGMAPFASFLQERYVAKAKGKNWLFFGERHRENHFYFEDFLTSLEKQNFLKLSLAFSRDQEKKIYVQHRIEEEAKTFCSWLKKGAYLYLCGDAKALAKDVETTIEKILCQEEKMSPEEAHLYLKTMRLEKRYRKDVY